MFSSMFAPSYYDRRSPSSYANHGKRHHYRQQQPSIYQGGFFDDFASPWEIDQREVLRERELQRERERQQYLYRLNQARQARQAQTKYRRYRPEPEPESASESESESEQITAQAPEQLQQQKQEPEQPAVPESSVPQQESDTEYFSADNDEEDTQEAKQEQELEQELGKKLQNIEAKLESSIATYTRINKASSSSSSSSSDDSYTTYNSRLKVMQRTQLELEKLYEQLDALMAPRSEENRRLKHKLTGRAVNFADKADELVSHLKLRMSSKPKSLPRANSPRVSSSGGQEQQQPKQQPKQRRVVTLESVSDDSEDSD